MRINKYLAMKGYATRRGADELIAKKIVTINGRLAVLGDKVNEADNVEVRKNKKTDGNQYIYYACNKPAGITLLDTRKGQEGFARIIPGRGIFPVGSLDRDAAGLVIFTNDRRIIDRLENPSHAHPRQYLVETREPFRSNFKAKLEAGVILEGMRSEEKPIQCHVSIKYPKAALITITDAKNRLRQICSLFGAETVGLTRTSILNIELGRLPTNSYRKIEGSELADFLKGLGL
jgi:pseudouridine synthase